MAAESYRDPELPVAQRVEDLLARMTTDEKAWQLTSALAGYEHPKRPLPTGRYKEQIANGIGHLSRPVGSTVMNADQAVEIVNELQRYLVEETRLGIPAISHEECLSGLLANGPTTFPQGVNHGAAWNPELTWRVAREIRAQVLPAGTRQVLTPLFDVARDPRWGRVEETFGEDPYLVARLGTAFVRGLQGEPGEPLLIATAKHFAGHSAPEGGRNAAPVHYGEREFRDIFLFPFEVAIREGGVRSVMNAYHDWDGVPCVASRWLLTDVLRGELGFDGTVVSDYESIDWLRKFFDVTDDRAEAAALAANAGIDIELPKQENYGPPLAEAVGRGLVTEERLDDLVRRVLRTKFALGLFENPYADPANAARQNDHPAARVLAREAARESLVLLKNEAGALPLRRQGTIALIGPHAADPRGFFGDYSFTAHHTHLGYEELSVAAPSVLEALRSRMGADARIVHARGCEILSDSRKGFEEALRTAKEADVIVFVGGGKSAAADLATCGEHLDRTELHLEGAQEALLLELATLGKPVVLVLVHGRPYVLTDVLDRMAAVLDAWLPGEEGGVAIAEALLGEYNPGGKSPMSFPKSVGQIPLPYNRRRYHREKSYIDCDNEPLIPFGHGLSYTTFAYSDLEVAPGELHGDGEVVVRCAVTNTGSAAGDEVVQLYIVDRLSSVVRPYRELKGFLRVPLGPGERKQVEFVLPADLLAFHDTAMRLVVEPGDFQVLVGSSSTDIRLEGSFRMAAPGLVYTEPRRRFETRASVREG